MLSSTRLLSCLLQPPSFLYLWLEQLHTIKKRHKTYSNEDHQCRTHIGPHAVCLESLLAGAFLGVAATTGLAGVVGVAFVLAVELGFGCFTGVALVVAAVV